MKNAQNQHSDTPMTNTVAVLDLGKTNPKLLAIASDGRILDSATGANRPPVDATYQQL